MLKRTILDIDSPTREQIHKALEQKREQDRQARHVYNGVLTLPKNYVKNCGGCGKQVFKQDMQIYFNELFCKVCVESWTTKG